MMNKSHRVRVYSVICTRDLTLWTAPPRSSFTLSSGIPYPRPSSIWALEPFRANHVAQFLDSHRISARSLTDTTAIVQLTPIPSNICYIRPAPSIGLFDHENRTVSADWQALLQSPCCWISFLPHLVNHVMFSPCFSHISLLSLSY